jgi:hypothetical protein
VIVAGCFFRRCDRSICGDRLANCHAGRGHCQARGPHPGRSGRGANPAYEQSKANTTPTGAWGTRLDVRTPISVRSAASVHRTPAFGDPSRSARAHARWGRGDAFASGGAGQFPARSPPPIGAVVCARWCGTAWSGARRAVMLGLGPWWGLPNLGGAAIGPVCLARGRGDVLVFAAGVWRGRAVVFC